jgi:DNA-binding NarL/FixJ family response regulator
MTDPSNHTNLIHLLLAEDSHMGCQLMADTFKRSRSAIKVTACAVSREDVVTQLKSHPCNVALISDTLSDGPLSGFHALRELRQTFPKVRPIMLLKTNCEDLVIDAFRAGAKGIYCRCEPLKTLVKCITAVHEGQIWASSPQLNSVCNAFANAAPLRRVDPNRRNPLTKRESDVVQLVVDGLSNREVGNKLGLTEHTVSNYLFRIYDKFRYFKPGCCIP